MLKQYSMLISVAQKVLIKSYVLDCGACSSQCYLFDTRELENVTCCHNNDQQNNREQ